MSDLTEIKMSDSEQAAVVQEVLAGREFCKAGQHWADLVIGDYCQDCHEAEAYAYGQQMAMEQEARERERQAYYEAMARGEEWW